MNLKKTMLLATMALTGMAFAIPATASAAWTHNHEPLEKEATFEVTGPMEFNIAGTGTGAHWIVHAIVHLKPGNTGTITDFTVTNCTGTGELEPLTCTATEQVAPWVIHANKGDGTIEVTDIDVHNEYFSPLDPGHTTPATTSLLTGDIKAIPDNDETISSLTLEEINTHVGEEEAPAEVSGTLSVVGEDAGTYGTT